MCVFLCLYHASIQRPEVNTGILSLDAVHFLLLLFSSFLSYESLTCLELSNSDSWACQWAPAIYLPAFATQVLWTSVTFSMRPGNQTHFLFVHHKPFTDGAISQSKVWIAFGIDSLLPVFTRHNPSIAPAGSLQIWQRNWCEVSWYHLCKEMLLPLLPHLPPSP